MEHIQEQMKEQFQNAFNDLVRDALQDDHPYIAKLYAEIRDRLASMVKPNGKTWLRIHEQLDVEFLEQLLKHNQFTTTSLIGLVNTTFEWIRMLQAPQRDSLSEAAKQRVLAGETAEDIVPTYIREVHGCLDHMEQDMKEFMDNREHPVVQEMLRRASRRS